MVELQDTRCSVIQNFDGTWTVGLGKGIVAWGVPYKPVAQAIADLCNSRLEESDA